MKQNKPTPEELMNVLEAQTSTLHITHIGKMAWLYVMLGDESYQEVVDKAKSQLETNFKRVMRGWDAEKRENEINEMLDATQLYQSIIRMRGE